MVNSLLMNAICARDRYENYMIYHNFQSWVHSVFKEPVLQEIQPGLLIEYITLLFNESDNYLVQYSDSEVADGLHSILSPSGFGYIGVMMSDTVSLGLKLDCLSAMVTLFQSFFSIKCGDKLMCCTKDSIDNPLSKTCFMWWDIALIYPAKYTCDWGSEFNESVIGAMDSILEIDSLACQESALHGLGHWESEETAFTIKKIVDRYIINKNVSGELLNYARNAKAGMIQ